MATLKHLDSRSFDLTIRNAEHPVLVDFHADWCGPCKALAPTLEAIAEVHGDALSVVKVDIDDNGDLATHYGIQKIPTLILFANGEPQLEINGVVTKGALLEKLRPFLAASEVVTT